VNAEELMAAASKVRFEKENHGEPAEIPCTVPSLTRSADRTVDLSLLWTKMGGMNVHLEIAVADGIVCLARIRQEDPTSPAGPTALCIRQSEMATLQFLQKVKGGKTPRVFHYAFDPGEE